MPSITRPQLTGLRSILMWDPFDDGTDLNLRHAEPELSTMDKAEHPFGEESIVSSNATRRVRVEK